MDCYPLDFYLVDRIIFVRCVISSEMRRKQGRPRIALPKEAVIRAYEAGASIRGLAKEFGVAYATVRSRLLGWGVKLRPACWPPEAWRGRIRDSPGGDSAESNPGVSESPPARHLTEKRRLILELEAKIAEGDVNLRQTRALKYEHEQELAKLKGMPGGR